MPSNDYNGGISSAEAFKNGKKWTTIIVGWNLIEKEENMTKVEQ